MDIDRPTALLGGLSPAQFMRRHWQKKPLLIRGAVDAPTLGRLPGREALWSLAQQEDAASRLIVRGRGGWQVTPGPLRRLPSPRGRQRWTVLVQGVNLHDAATAALMRRFRFIPDARLDDVMMSYASDGGGVGAHADSYDVFLLQTHGVRRWRIAPLRSARDRELVPGAPLKLLRHFAPAQQWNLQPGDMLYLPPGWGHDGVAQGECITLSVGFRAPSRGELLARVLERMADAVRDDPRHAQLYRDPRQPATSAPHRLPEALLRFVREAWPQRIDARMVEAALGEYLSEPKPQVWFDAPPRAGWRQALTRGLRLADKSQMLCGARRCYVNGEGIEPATAAERRWWQAFARTRGASAAQLAVAPPAVQRRLREWLQCGWVECAAGRREGAGDERE
jgi:50S ribosomal protein L16 3-hydroxylase